MRYVKDKCLKVCDRNLGFEEVNAPCRETPHIPTVSCRLGLGCILRENVTRLRRRTQTDERRVFAWQVVKCQIQSNFCFKVNARLRGTCIKADLNA